MLSQRTDVVRGAESAVASLAAHCLRVVKRLTPPHLRPPGERDDAYLAVANGGCRVTTMEAVHPKVGAPSAAGHVDGLRRLVLAERRAATCAHTEQAELWWAHGEAKIASGCRRGVVGASRKQAPAS
eukprot:2478434-Prymnesium_polylepis.1